MLRVLLFSVAIGSLGATCASAQTSPYQRTRGGANDWHARGGHSQPWRTPYGGYVGFYDPYFAAPPIIAGSFYQRPYPYHFDYYRHRWGASPAAPNDAAADDYVTPDCPCAVPPPLEVVQ